MSGSTRVEGLKELIHSVFITAKNAECFVAFKVI